MTEDEIQLHDVRCGGCEVCLAAGEADRAALQAELIESRNQLVAARARITSRDKHIELLRDSVEKGNKALNLTVAECDELRTKVARLQEALAHRDCYFGTDWRCKRPNCDGFPDVAEEAQREVLGD